MFSDLRGELGGGGLHGVATWTETSALCIVVGPASDVDGGLALCIS